MESILLGLLLIRERTLYDLKKIFETKVGLFYSASFGSIGAALEKLVQKGWVTVHAAVEQGRHKKYYQANAAGQAAFTNWLMSPIPHEQVREPALTRLFFLGYMPRHERLPLIEQHLDRLRAQYAGLTLLAEEQATSNHQPELADLIAFQRLTLQYGRDYYAFSIDWYERLIATLKEEHDD